MVSLNFVIMKHGICATSIMAATSSGGYPGNVASVTEEMKFSFHFIVTNLNFNRHMCQLLLAQLAWSCSHTALIKARYNSKHPPCPSCYHRNGE